MTDLRDRVRAFVDDVLARTPVKLTSPLAHDEIVRRLGAAIDSDWALFGSKSVVGRVDKTSFRLRQRIRYRNSFQTFLFGTMTADGRSTRLDCRVGMHPMVAGFIALWLFAVSGLLVAALASVPADETVLLIAIPAGMFVFGIGLVLLGRWLARNEQRQLVAFLEQTIEAQRQA